MAEPVIREVLEDLSVTFTASMNGSLAQDIIEKGLASAIHLMAKGKTTGHDRIPMEFFQRLWSTSGPDFHRMLCNGFDEEKLFEGVTKGFLLALSRRRMTSRTSTWRPITLLTAGYKIHAKIPQSKLRPILRDVISPKQTAFLPLRIILDNIVLIQETLHWANISRQRTVFLKLNFSKAYDKVS